MPAGGGPAPREQDRARNRHLRARLVLPDPSAVEGLNAIDQQPSMSLLATELAKRAEQGDPRAAEAQLRGQRADVAGDRAHRCPAVRVVDDRARGERGSDDLEREAAIC